jgi:hypothetical protein
VIKPGQRLQFALPALAGGRESVENLNSHFASRIRYCYSNPPELRADTDTGTLVARQKKTDSLKISICRLNWITHQAEWSHPLVPACADENS